MSDVKIVLALAKQTLTDLSQCHTGGEPEVIRCFHCDEFMDLAVWPAHGNPKCVVGTTIAEIDKALEPSAEERLLRQLLWLNHGHVGLYGDDGEMQCHECGIDFKRLPAAEIRDRIRDRALTRLAAICRCMGSGCHPDEFTGHTPECPWRKR